MAVDFRPPARTPFSEETPEIQFRCKKLIRFAIFLFL